MRYYIFFPVLILLFCCGLSLDGQTKVTISKKEFKSNRTGFEAAWRHVIDGNKYYKVKGVSYGKAFDEYKKAVDYNSINPELNYKAGVAALYSDNKNEAVKFFRKVLEEKSDLTGDVLFFTGRALQYSGKYNEAIEKLESYLKTPGKKPKAYIASAKRYIEECKSALEVTKDTLRIEINNIGAGINSISDDYAEIISGDGKTIFFASRRQLSKSSTQYDDLKFDENILTSTLNESGWGLPVSIGKNLTTPYCETPLYLSPTDDELYVYVGYEKGGNIMVSEKKKGEWKTPGRVSFNINSGGMETSMTFSPSGDEVWYVTNKEKGILGGKDIYMKKKLEGHRWSKPVNAGPMINSSFDEESIRFSKGGDTLWFSSKGHNSTGGFDIFYSVKDKTGTWGKAINYGYPVNTPWDEIFFYPASNRDSTFYFASNRPESIGGLDIFRGRILPPEPVIIPVAPPKPDTVIVRDTVVIIKEIAPPPVVEPPKETGLYLIGKVKDSETSEPVMAKLDIVDFSTDLVVGSTSSSDVDGSYRIKLPAKKTYIADIRASGFLSDMKRINIPATYSGEAYNLDISLIKVKVGKKVVLNNILFETGKSVLTKSSYDEIDRLLSILEENQKMRIEISGHTDKTGSEPLNFKLSENRAKAVVDYLVQKGISTSRLEYKGYGSLQPVADNATAAGRAKNRRVEFKILGF
jgi:flagellar motor protein MotB